VGKRRRGRWRQLVPPGFDDALGTPRRGPGAPLGPAAPHRPAGRTPDQWMGKVAKIWRM